MMDSGSDSGSDSVFGDFKRVRHHEPAIPTDWNAFWDVVQSRRSVRIYTDQALPEKDFRDCLKAALLAPNSSNLQTWEFYWVRSQPKKAQLVQACFSQSAARTAQEIVVCVARPGNWRRHAKWMADLIRKDAKPSKAMLMYYEKIAPLAYMIGPFGIFGWIKRIAFSIIGLFRPVPREPVSRKELEIWSVKSAALACENFMLALRAKGFDSCPMEGLDSRRVRRILDLPNDAVIVMAISAGYRAPDGVYGPQIRFDEKNFLFEV